MLSDVSGKRLLNLHGRCVLQTEDGCDVDNYEGLVYAIGERQRVIFWKERARTWISREKQRRKAHYRLLY